MEHNDEALRLNLDLLDEKREQVLKHTKDYQRKAARYYNQKVKPRSYLPGDLVLSYCQQGRIQHMENWAPTGKALISYLESSDQAIMSSKQRRGKFYSRLGMQNILNVFISRSWFVMLNGDLSIFS